MRMASRDRQLTVAKHQDLARRSADISACAIGSTFWILSSCPLAMTTPFRARAAPIGMPPSARLICAAR